MVETSNYADLIPPKTDAETWDERYPVWKQERDAWRAKMPQALTDALREVEEADGETIPHEKVLRLAVAVHGVENDYEVRRNMPFSVLARAHDQLRKYHLQGFDRYVDAEKGIEAESPKLGRVH